MFARNDGLDRPGPPCPHATMDPSALEPQTVIPAPCDGDETRVGRGDVGLTVVVPSPGHDGPVGLETQTVGVARGDGDKAALGAGTLV